MLGQPEKRHPAYEVPKSDPPPTHLEFRAGGWRGRVPTIFVTAMISGFVTLAVAWISRPAAPVPDALILSARQCAENTAAIQVDLRVLKAQFDGLSNQTTLELSSQGSSLSSLSIRVGTLQSQVDQLSRVGR